MSFNYTKQFLRQAFKVSVSSGQKSHSNFHRRVFPANLRVFHTFWLANTKLRFAHNLLISSTRGIEISDPIVQLSCVCAPFAVAFDVMIGELMLAPSRESSWMSLNSTRRGHSPSIICSPPFHDHAQFIPVQTTIRVRKNENRKKEKKNHISLA